MPAYPAAQLSLEPPSCHAEAVVVSSRREDVRLRLAVDVVDVVVDADVLTLL